MSNAPLPAGFEAYGEPSPYLDRIGPLYQCLDGPAPVFAVRILEHHCNRRGYVHGGLLSALSDITLGKTSAWTEDPPAPLITASLTTEFIGNCKIGDWLEARADFHRVGRAMAFANCYLTVDGNVIARSSAVFRVARDRHKTRATGNGK